MRVTKLAAAAALLASVVIAGTTTLAGAAQSGGKIRVFVTSTSATKGKILVTGAIGDYGTTLSVNKNGKPNPNGDYQKVTLKKGGFWVNGTALQKKLDSMQPKANPSNCSLAFTGTAPTSLFKGTGAYAGIGGKINITVTFAGIAPRITSGAKAGQCNFANNVNPIAQYQSITGTGNVHFG
ncbi:MAG: hypothetical protein WAK93_09865 [Solirubrobacteraceae bacterium]